MVNIKKIDLESSRLSKTSFDAKNGDFIPESSIIKSSFGDENGEVELLFLENGTSLVEKDGIGMAYTDQDGFFESLHINNDFKMLNYSGARELSSSLVEEFSGPHSKPRILLTDFNGNVKAYYGEDVMGETASVAKIFVALAACELLDPNYEIEITRDAVDIAWPSNDIGCKAGDKITVSEALSSGFPLSDNVAANSLVIELGKKYCDCSDDRDAYNKGLNFLNAYLQKKGFNTRLSTAAGFNTGADFDYSNYGISKSQNWGARQIDVTNCLMQLYNNKVFRESFRNKSSIDTFKISLEKHEAVRDYMKKDNILTGADLFGGDKKDGLYFIKSGTQGYNSGTFVIVDQGEVDFLTMQGINTIDDGGNYIELAHSIYQDYINSK